MEADVREAAEKAAEILMKDTKIQKAVIVDKVPEGTIFYSNEVDFLKDAIEIVCEVLDYMKSNGTITSIKFKMLNLPDNSVGYTVIRL